MEAQESHEYEHDENAVAAGARGETDRDAAHGATAPAPAPAQARRRHRPPVAAGLIGAGAVTLVSLVFIVTFIGGLHSPGPRSVPIGIVGTHAQASGLARALDQVAPGGYAVHTYPSTSAARGAILNRTIDAALTPGRRAPVLLVATAASPALARATFRDVRVVAASAHTLVTVQDVRPLPSRDPDSLSQVYFVIALMTPSLLFGSMLVSKISPRLNPIWQLGIIAVYAAVVAAVATAFADPVFGALTGAPWGIFGIGALLAFASAAISAAVRRWTGGIGYVVLGLLLIPVGISASGTTLGPNMITPWYADLGKALLPGSAMPAVQNTVYFNGNDIINPLLIMSAWALAGILALVMASFLHPPIPGQAAKAQAQEPRGATRVTA